MTLEQVPGARFVRREADPAPTTDFVDLHYRIGEHRIILSAEYFGNTVWTPDPEARPEMTAIAATISHAVGGRVHDKTGGG